MSPLLGALPNVPTTASRVVVGDDHVRLARGRRVGQVQRQRGAGQGHRPVGRVPVSLTTHWSYSLPAVAPAKSTSSVSPLFSVKSPSIVTCAGLDPAASVKSLPPVAASEPPMYLPRLDVHREPLGRRVDAALDAGVRAGQRSHGGRSDIHVAGHPRNRARADGRSVSTRWCILSSMRKSVLVRASKLALV